MLTVAVSYEIELQKIIVLNPKDGEKHLFLQVLRNNPSEFQIGRNRKAAPQKRCRLFVVKSIFQ